MAKTPIKKILIATSIFSPDIGGPATYVPQMADYLVRKGHRVTVVTLRSRGSHSTFSHSPYALVEIPFVRPYPLQFLKTWQVLFPLICHSDIVYACGLWLETILLSRLFRKKVWARIVSDEAWERAQRLGWTELDLESFQEATSLSLGCLFLRAIRTLYAHFSHGIVVPSSYLGLLIKRWGLAHQKVVVCPNPLPPLSENFSGGRSKSFREDKTEYGSQEGGKKRLRVITVGRLIPLKNIEGIIEAIVSLDNVTLSIAGDGPSLGFLKNYAQTLRIGHRVLFLGRLSQEQVFKTLSQHDLFILNSIYETFPTVILEALSCGIPVVAARVGGIPDMIRHKINGYLIPSQDVESLRKALVWIEHHPQEVALWRERGYQTAARFMSANSLERVATLLTS